MRQSRAVETRSSRCSPNQRSCVQEAARKAGADLGLSRHARFFLRLRAAASKGAPEFQCTFLLRKSGSHRKARYDEHQDAPEGMRANARRA